MPIPFRLVLVAVSLAAYCGAPTAGQSETHYNPAGCPKSLNCGDGVEVHYPFFLANASITIDGTAYSSYCGYPGMAIACDGGRATLRLKDDNYTVLSIDYPNHTVTVADSGVLDGGGDCPRVNHSVTVPTETWLNLSTTANDNLAFYFDCSIAPPPIPPINCSSFPEQDGVSYVAAEPDVPHNDQLRGACREVVVVPVLKQLLLGSDEYLPVLNSDGYGKLLKQGFQLTWDPSQGPCYVCEKSGGQCSYNQSGRLLGCLCSDAGVRSQECGSPKSKKNNTACM